LAAFFCTNGEVGERIYQKVRKKLRSGVQEVAHLAGSLEILGV
jgi:hypothetical protein